MPAGLECIEGTCFAGSGLEEVQFPAGLKVVGAEAFRDCESLRHAELNEGLKVFGEKWNCGGNELRGMAFACSEIKSVRIPSTLKIIEAYTFAGCNSLKTVELSEGLEKIGVGAFTESAIENAGLP